MAGTTREKSEGSHGASEGAGDFGEIEGQSTMSPMTNDQSVMDQLLLTLKQREALYGAGTQTSILMKVPTGMSPAPLREAAWRAP